MSTETIEVPTDRGTMPTTLFTPEGEGPFPLVILFMDAPGVREDLDDAATRLTAAGYAAALPDLYYALDPAARPDPRKLAAGDEAEFARLAPAAASIVDAEVLADTHALLEALESSDAVGPGGWACVGFCLGGRLALRAASEFGAQVLAVSMVHPSRLVTDAPDSPHRSLAPVSAELYFGFGENDHVTPVSTIAPLREELDGNHVEHRIDVLAGADHGYSMPRMPAYNRAAAERAWEETLALLGRRVPVSG